MRILVIEDEAEIARDIADAFRAIGYVAEIAADGEDAWFRGSTEDFDVIILDLSLPKLDGTLRHSTSPRRGDRLSDSDPHSAERLASAGGGHRRRRR